MVILETAIQGLIQYSENMFEGRLFFPMLRRDDEREQTQFEARNLEISVDSRSAGDRTGAHCLQRQSADNNNNRTGNVIDDCSADFVVHFTFCHHNWNDSAPTIYSRLITDTTSHPNANHLDAVAAC